MSSVQIEQKSYEMSPRDGFTVTHFITVADIWACYKEWGNKGAFFLTEPLNNHGCEWRCHMRDPDGYLIEVGQSTEIAPDWFKNAGNLASDKQAGERRAMRICAGFVDAFTVVMRFCFVDYAR